MRLCFSAITMGFALLTASAVAEPKPWSTIGTLECTMKPSIHLAMAARQKTECAFRSTASTAVVTYNGRVEQPGLDLALTGGKLVWIVLSRDGLPPQSLFGRYSDLHGGTVGTADASAALCRSSQRAICLLPLADADHEDGDNFAFRVSAVRIE